MATKTDILQGQKIVFNDVLNSTKVEDTKNIKEEQKDEILKNVNDFLSIHFDEFKEFIDKKNQEKEKNNQINQENISTNQTKDKKVKSSDILMNIDKKEKNDKKNILLNAVSGVISETDSQNLINDTFNYIDQKADELDKKALKLKKIKIGNFFRDKAQEKCKDFIEKNKNTEKKKKISKNKLRTVVLKVFKDYNKKLNKKNVSFLEQISSYNVIILAFKNLMSLFSKKHNKNTLIKGNLNQKIESNKLLADKQEEKIGENTTKKEVFEDNFSAFMRNSQKQSSFLNKIIAKNIEILGKKDPKYQKLFNILEEKKNSDNVSDRFVAISIHMLIAKRLSDLGLSSEEQRDIATLDIFVDQIKTILKDNKDLTAIYTQIDTAIQQIVKIQQGDKTKDDKKENSNDSLYSGKNSNKKALNNEQIIEEDKIAENIEEAAKLIKGAVENTINNLFTTNDLFKEINNKTKTTIEVKEGEKNNKKDSEVQEISIKKEDKETNNITEYRAKVEVNDAKQNAKDSNKELKIDSSISSLTHITTSESESKKNIDKEEKIEIEDYKIEQLNNFLDVFADFETELSVNKNNKNKKDTNKPIIGNNPIYLTDTNVAENTAIKSENKLVNKKGKGIGI